jgi:hypothetical protein
MVYLEKRLLKGFEKIESMKNFHLKLRYIRMKEKAVNFVEKVFAYTMILFSYL